ncbi:hypothetical protein EMCRGX_G018868 [Ephydatia muelleri]
MDETYYLHDEYVEAESEDGFTYEEVAVDEISISSGEEDLDTALHNLHVAKQPATIEKASHISSEPVSQHPEVIEDYVRNFLVHTGLHRTMETFQGEWYELMQTGRLGSDHAQQLPDVYSQNRQLQSKMQELQSQMFSYKEAARIAKEKYVGLKKECDYHRMHHRRVLQEKNKLMADIKKLQQHINSYEPVLKALKNKYETVTKEKMLACMERDKAVSEVSCLQSTLHSLQPSSPTRDETLDQPNVAGNDSAAKATEMEVTKTLGKLPDDPSNPYLSAKLPQCAHLTRTGGFQLTNQFQAHDFAVSNVCMHAEKDVLVTTSDDHTWKMWAMEGGDLLMTGEGHSDWVGRAAFHPNGKMLATCSGDGTVKIWDFGSVCCVATLSDHQQPVWGCGWHWSGQLMASASMDHCCKLWDVESARCCCTLRGHTQCVNAVQFLPYSSVLCSCSQDKTVSLWDARTALCVQTLCAHQHSCNDVISNAQGTLLFSADCFGNVVCWDIRKASSINQWQLGPSGVNALAVDPAGTVMACASNSGSVILIDPHTSKEWTLVGHTDYVLGVGYSPLADSLVSGDSAGHVIVWQ